MYQDLKFFKLLYQCINYNEITFTTSKYLWSWKCFFYFWLNIFLFNESEILKRRVVWMLFTHTYTLTHTHIDASHSFSLPFQAPIPHPTPKNPLLLYHLTLILDMCVCVCLCVCECVYVSSQFYFKSLCGIWCIILGKRKDRRNKETK